MSDTSQQVRDRYLQRIAVYESLGYDRLAAVRYVVDQVAGFQNPVLDVGTGQGLLATEFARRGAEVMSIDASEEEQRVGKVNAEQEGVADRIAFLTVDVSRLAFPDGTFGVVAMFDALHHLTDGPAAFGQMLRVMKPCGRMLLAELNAEGLALVARVHAGEGRVHPVGPVTMRAALDWFLAKGLRIASLTEAQLHSVAVLAGGGDATAA